MWSQATSGQVWHKSPKPPKAASLLDLVSCLNSKESVLSVAEGKIGATRFRHSLAAIRTEESLSSKSTERWSNNSSGHVSATEGRADNPAILTSTSSCIKLSRSMLCPLCARTPESTDNALIPSIRPIWKSFSFQATR